MKILGLTIGKSDNGRKPYQHNDRFVYRWQTLPDSIGEEYETSTLLEIANRHSTYPTHVAKKLRSLGVILRPASSKPGRFDLRCKLTSEQIVWALEQDDKDVTHAEIGRHLGVSRERIRQICSQSGKPTRRSRQTKVIEIKEAAAARKLEREQRVSAISEAWKSGATLKELNDAFFHYKHHFFVSSRICAYRSIYPDLFPLRMKSHVPRQFQSPEEVEQLSKLWLSDKTPAEIAKIAGYKTAESLKYRVGSLRQRFPKLFPPRKSHNVFTLAQLEERKKKLSDLWKANKPAAEIMEVMGYRSIKSVYQAVTKWRKKEPEMFPLRAPSPPNKK